MLHLYTSSNIITNALLSPDKIREQQQQQTSRSSNQLHRYNHDPILNNSTLGTLRRDLLPIIILLVFLILVIIILVQILIVHTSRYGSNYSSMQKIQEELKEMDKSMETILRDNVLPIDKWRLLFHIQRYVYRFQDLFYLFKKQNYTIYNSSDIQTKRNYCDEQPNQLRMLK
jgi:hypothetical protein